MASRFLTSIDGNVGELGKKRKSSEIAAVTTASPSKSLPTSVSITVDEDSPSRMSRARSNLSISGDSSSLVS